MKTKAAFSYQFKNYLRLFGWTYLWAIVLVVFLPLLIALILGQIHGFSVADYLPRVLPAIVVGSFVFAFGGITYDGFKLFIQNGIGRKTYFYSKLLALSSILLIGELINVVYGVLYTHFISNRRAAIFAFSSLYGKYFNSKVENTISVIVITLLFIVCIMVTGMLLGTILGLFSRRAQMMLIVGAPILLIILLAVLMSVNTQNRLISTWLPQFLLYIIGMSDMSTPQGHFIAFAPMISGSVYIIIVLVTTYYLTLRLRVPR
ncbi:hypothetical protein [Secundilactobacillus folii]|uniref:Uncharacterized protein n=1 Tax=Secundilactobacillus folii TaxID=2678357 RepID=A0A7X3C3M6_9LACO|nr:hypothetical protein [Secundilactobacillus folii]MTV83022.1 hypothetical protein [Secundilactobacillus folii]